MPSRRLPRVSGNVGLANDGSAVKRPTLSGYELSKLAELLSDSDEWDDTDQSQDQAPGSVEALQKPTQYLCTDTPNATIRREPVSNFSSVTGEANEVRSTTVSATNNCLVSILEGKSYGDVQSKVEGNIRGVLTNCDNNLLLQSTHQEIEESQQSGKLPNLPTANINGVSSGVPGEQSQDPDPDVSEVYLEDSSVLEIDRDDVIPGTFERLEREDPIDIPDDNSIEIVQERLPTKYSEKFTLTTQLPAFAPTQEKVQLLKLPPNTKVKVPIRLSAEQEHIIDLAEKGYNIFYTGSAGTGKSVLLKELIKCLKRKYGKENVAVTASTGLAACNIGGYTIHSFSGVGLGKGDADLLYRKVRRSRKHLRRWETISALVVDEISMLDGDLLDKLDIIAQRIRKNPKPFGGIQVIFCGDFFQLPPVNTDNNKETKFAFESTAWKNGVELTIVLEKVFRQQGDTKFIEMLNKMRMGQIDEATEREFKKLCRPLPNDDIIPAELYSTRLEVERANNLRLSKLPGAMHSFSAIDGGSLQDTELREKLLQNFLAPRELQLKIGAQVMMIKNIDETLVNGTLGKVIDFIDLDTYFLYELLNENPELPVEELERLRDDPNLLKSLKKHAEEGDTMTTVTRQKTSKKNFVKYRSDEPIEPLGESIFDFLQAGEKAPKDPESERLIEKKKELLREFHMNSSGRKLPLVKFKSADLTPRIVLVEPEDWAIEDEREKPIVSRVQLPLMLAWSLSIHKSQGQTLQKVKVDLGRIFEKGQAYVALSRAVSRDGLQVLNFDKRKVTAHQKVIDFYLTLTSAETAAKQVRIKDATNKILKRKLQFEKGKTNVQFAPNRPNIHSAGYKKLKKRKKGPSKIVEMLHKRAGK